MRDLTERDYIMRDLTERDYIIIVFISQLTWDHYFYIIGL
jgi:hypothetical protein